MKLWILTATKNYEDNFVIGVYTSLKKGKDAMKRYYESEKVDINTVNFYEDKDYFGKTSYTAHSEKEEYGSGGIKLREIETDKDTELYV